MKKIVKKQVRTLKNQATLEFWDFSFQAWDSLENEGFLGKKEQSKNYQGRADPLLPKIIFDFY